MSTRRSQVKAPETVRQLRRRLVGWTVTYCTQDCYESVQQRHARTGSTSVHGRLIKMHVVRAVPAMYAKTHYWRGVPYVEARSSIKRAACGAVLKGAREMEMEEGV